MFLTEKPEKIKTRICADPTRKYRPRYRPKGKANYNRYDTNVSDEEPVNVKVSETISIGDGYAPTFRPRGFGKSLLCSTISHLFGGKKSIELFENLWISNQGVWKFEDQENPVIHLDMSSVAGIDSNKEMFYNKVRDLLMAKAKQFSPPVNIPNANSITIARLFVRLIIELQKRYNKKVVVIIDDYDKPVLDLLDQPKEMEEINSALQTFYAILKSCESDLKLVFMTGLYKFTPTSMFSTFNNITDLTFKLQAGTLC
eukprot:gene20293-26343_t